MLTTSSRIHSVQALAVALLLGAAPGLCAAQSPAGPERGELLAVSCFSCHGPDGNSAGAMPSIAGKQADYIAERLRAWRDGSRPATVMNRLAKGYSDTDIEELARYFASH